MEVIIEPEKITLTQPTAITNIISVPGCGKTSTIQAIANHTQRHIINIPLKDIRNIQELRSIFYGSRINKKPIPMHKRLFVIEDIDCNSLMKTVGKRENSTHEVVEEDTTNTAKKILPKDESHSSSEESSWSSTSDSQDSEKPTKEKKVKRRQKKKKKERKSKLTLGDLLEVFDGVLEMKGRMMVVTTNHPERLDPALTR